jgi:preprotein translocase subunit SecE
LAWLSNRPSMADFFIAAEGEIKKVSWSSRKEIVASTTIVVVVVAIFTILLYAADLLFAVLFRQVLNVY